MRHLSREDERNIAEFINKGVSLAELSSCLEDLRLEREAPELAVDTLIRQRSKFAGQTVRVRGILTGYEMGPGWSTWPVQVRLGGADRSLIAEGYIARVCGQQDLQPRLEARMGGEVLLVVDVTHEYGIKTILF